MNNNNYNDGDIDGESAEDICEEYYDEINVAWDNSIDINMCNFDYKFQKCVLFLKYTRKIFTNGCYKFECKLNNSENKDIIKVFISRQYFEFNYISKGEEISNKLRDISFCIWKDVPMIFNSLFDGYLVDPNYEFDTKNNKICKPFEEKNVKVTWNAFDGSDRFDDNLPGFRLLEKWNYIYNRKSYLMNRKVKSKCEFYCDFIIKPDSVKLNNNIPAELYENEQFSKSMKLNGLLYIQNGKPKANKKRKISNIIDLNNKKNKTQKINK
jgi:hypothetical protein